MSKKTRELNASLSGGYTSEGLQTDGENFTFAAMFDGLTANTPAHLEQSVDGETPYQEVPDSATTLEAGQTVQNWNGNNTVPRGTMLRIVVGSGSGTITQIKLLSNG